MALLCPPQGKPSPLTRPRIILPADLAPGRRYPLDSETAHYVQAVLRCRDTAPVVVSDGGGTEWEGRLRNGSPPEIEIVRARPAASPAAAFLILGQALPKGNKIEAIIQGATELGVAAIVPFVAERCVVRLSPERTPARVARWRKISREAARLSRRADVPAVAEVCPFPEAVARGAAAQTKLLLWEEEAETELAAVLREGANPGEVVALFVGPEGGFTADEVCLARSQGFRTVSLGRRILRVETAALVCLAVLQYARGELAVAPQGRREP